MMEDNDAHQTYLIVLKARRRRKVNVIGMVRKKYNENKVEEITECR